MIMLFDIGYIAPLAAGLMLIGSLIMLSYAIYLYYKGQEIAREGISRNTQLAAVMHACHIRIWLIHPFKERYVLLAEDGTEEASFSPIDVAGFFQHDDFEKMRQLILDIRDRKTTHGNCRIRGKKHEDGTRSTYDVSIRILEKSSLGWPKTIIAMQRDITEKLEQQHNVNNLLLLYHTFFDSNVIDMMYYDKDGVLKDINKKACETFGIKDREALLARGLNIRDIPAYSTLDIKHLEGYRMTSVTDIANIRRKTGTKLPEVTLTGKVYYDTIMSPIHDENGQISGIYSAGQCINEKVSSYQRQQESTRELQHTNQHIQDYIANINLALRVSEVRLMNYQPATHELEISNDVNAETIRLTQVKCLQLVTPEYRKHVAGLLRKMDHRENTRIDVTLHTLLRDSKGRETWLTLSLIPMRKADGTVSHYFGMCRNETEMVETAALLKEESMKAQEAELLKDAFLQNMSHEIRTPLSAVIGFAELLSADHDPEEEPVFIDYIKTNSNHLLQLVNDVLFISRLDAHMVEIKKQPTDFAMLFDGWCHNGWAGHQRDVNVIVENPYSHLVVDIDDANLALVVQKLCTNAATHTSEGFILAKYEYRHGMLTISIEDSGRGMDSKTQKRVFDRFYRSPREDYNGTGLMLPIVKELTERMDGVIELQSEPGKGCTIWVSLPCTATQMEKKDHKTR
ncbi:MAG: PAS domain-containing protein [Prevotella sp.]|nr:PAS domain-containing protein [Prevotella sp.]